MNKLLSILMVLMTSNAFAAGAQSYICGGTLETNTNTIPISFEVNYSDWVLGQGYTTEVLSVTAPATAVTGIDLAIFRTNVENNSNCFSLNELEYQSVNGNEYYKLDLNFKCSSVRISGFCGKN